MKQIEIEKYVKYMPSIAPSLERFNNLHKSSKTRIAVFGKYNHGKSSLLNALVGEDIFKVADKRETTEVKEHESSDVIWIDTPGLDADTAGEDDRLAIKSAMELADFILLVHRADTGELDKYERDFYNSWIARDSSYRNKLYLTLTAIDQLSTEEGLEEVYNAIQEQFQDLTIIPVSATCYDKGSKEGKQKLVELSGMDKLFGLVASLQESLGSLRKKEGERLLRKARLELSSLIKNKQAALTTSRHELRKQKSRYNSRVKGFLETI